MFKKSVFLLFFLVSIVITIDGAVDFFDPRGKYLLSFAMLVIGAIIYPTDYKFEKKVDFMVFPVFVLIIFNVFNIFFMQEYARKLDFFNYLLAAFCFLQFVVYRGIKRSGADSD